MKKLLYLEIKPVDKWAHKIKVCPTALGYAQTEAKKKLTES